MVMASRGKSAREVQEEIERALRKRQTGLSRYWPFLVGGIAGAVIALPLAIGMAALFQTGGLPFTPDREAETTSLETDTGLASEVPAPLGPLKVEAVYCWHRDSDSTERLRFVIYNPTDKEWTVRVPHGPVRVGARQVESSGDLDLTANAASSNTDLVPECKYKFLIEEGELTATSNLTLTVTEIKGLRLESPQAESLELVDRLLDDLEAADLDSIENYLDPIELRVDVVALIAWRSTIRPVRVEVARCSPEFSVSDPTARIREPLFTADSWLCDFSVQYASTLVDNPSSGAWTVKVRQDLTTAKRVVIPSNP